MMLFIIIVTFCNRLIEMKELLVIASNVVNESIPACFQHFIYCVNLKCNFFLSRKMYSDCEFTHINEDESHFFYAEFINQ
jgi:hypothetical protein